MNTKKLVVAAGLWTAALFLVVWYAVWPTPIQGLGAVGVLVGMLALALTMSLLLDHHRLRVGEILLLAEAERARRDGDVRPIR